MCEILSRVGLVIIKYPQYIESSMYEQHLIFLIRPHFEDYIFSMHIIKHKNSAL